MNQKTKEDIALFRYSLIAPLITNTFTQSTMKAYLEQVCNKTHKVPHYGFRTFAPQTLKGWYSAYKKHGIEGLYPQRRSDKGNSRVLSDQVKQFIIDAKTSNPKRSAKSIYQELLTKNLSHMIWSLCQLFNALFTIKNFNLQSSMLKNVMLLKWLTLMIVGNLMPLLDLIF